MPPARKSPPGSAASALTALLTPVPRDDQALVVGLIGYGLGMGGTSLFFTLTQGAIPLKGFHMIWQVMVGTAGAVAIIVTLASLLSIRKVLVLEPAVVFR